MKILAIETSCDDTGIAILEIKGTTLPKFNVISNIVSSQQIHQNYGGVFPMMAKREHQKNLVPVLEQALKQAKFSNSKSQILWTRRDSRRLHPKQIEIIKKILEKECDLYEKLVEFLQTYQKPNVDAIAVTYGPGLEPCLWVGVNFAKVLSYVWKIPIIPVNHIEAHILVNFLENKTIKSPAISLVVSGGHTQLILIKDIGKYKIIGETRDDAAGECFDKTAKILGLGYPGGPIISQIAAKTKESHIELPRPMINSKDYDFSFSGLKTAVLYKVHDTKVDEQFKNEMCVAVQEAICDVLLKKTLQAAKDYKAKTIILGGGVSANQELRKQLIIKTEEELSPFSDGRRKKGIRVIFPPPSLSTDNGLMIAVAGYFNRIKKKRWQSLKANANLRVGE